MVKTVTTGKGSSRGRESNEGNRLDVLEDDSRFFLQPVNPVPKLRPKVSPNGFCRVQVPKIMDVHAQVCYGFAGQQGTLDLPLGIPGLKIGAG
jgi:hypothetical protein